MELLTLVEIAKLLRLSPHTVRKWVQSRRIPIVRLGRKTLFNYEKISAFVTKHSVPEKDNVAEGGQKGKEVTNDV